jgi:hypothetical protein
METASVDRLRRVLDKLAGAGLAEKAARADAAHRAALGYEQVPRLPVVFSYPDRAGSDCSALPGGLIYRDPAAMLHNELVSAWGSSILESAAIGDDLCPTIRPNWGTVLVASALGGNAEQIGDDTPWIRRGAGKPISLEAIAEADPDLPRSGWIPRVLETYAAFRELLAPYPEVAAGLQTTLPDLQGPLDTVEQLLGADLFTEMVDRPDLVRAALRRTAEIQISCFRLFAPYATERVSGYSHQHGFLVVGGILIRDDSTVMLSPGMYRDLVAPADEAVLSAVGGGGIHSCGRVEHAVPEMLALASVRCIDFGQAWMNDVDRLYGPASEQGIPFLRVRPTREELETASVLDRFPTGVALSFPADSSEDARGLFDAYLRNAEARRR